MIADNGKNIENLLHNECFKEILEYLLTEKGLNYANLPKAHLMFHNYQNENRTALEEHLVEAANYSRSGDNVNLHFTVSTEDIARFEKIVENVKTKYEKTYGVKFQVDYSFQKPSTDQIAVNLKNEIFKNDDGSILFCPGGHGALIENLNELNAEIIFIKNIDNVVPDKLKEITYRYKKLIGGYLLEIQKQIHEFLLQIAEGGLNDIDIHKLQTFIKKYLYFDIAQGFFKMEEVEQYDYLYSFLNRPVRICGMVKNEGEPGGGPFWVKDNNGNLSLQIIEKSQLDINDEKQKNIFLSATHFNPVDLVCAIKDVNGKNFQLKDFVDYNTGFISIKSKGGKELKAQELPGLWNGAMADWLTIFVEVPIETFNPVKTINDLLRQQH